ncbi:MAG: hypothetical protein DRJ50_03675 [Actinobacteria bacterium]|nr:MAG: hypothetical protein DRJ50_03675 [Actinomycetota bacterium]
MSNSSRDGSSASLAISELYIEAYESFVEFARTLSDDEWSTAMQCTPEWTVREVLSHVAGIPDDGLAGRLDGFPGEPWTAAQIERNRDCSIVELFDRWDVQASEFAAAIEAMGEPRPAFDCHTHEHDIRHAIGRPGNRDTNIVDTAGTGFADGFTTPFAVTIEFEDGRSFSSGGEADTDSLGVTLRGVTPFDLFRSRLGRRTRDQVRGLDWVGADEDIDLVIDDWFVFGPSEIPIDE